LQIPASLILGVLEGHAPVAFCSESFMPA
jgi:hypothetical protein